MPFGSEPKCCMCKSSSSNMWRKNDEDEIVCNSCSLRSATINKHRNNSNGCHFTLRKSTRVKSSKMKQQIMMKTNVIKGKSRRVSFKKSCTKAPTPLCVPIEESTVFHNGSYFQVGDIVSLVDLKGGVYYAQIRGLLQDQYCEKSAVITWLLPTVHSPKGRFDPSSYILGPEEEMPRKLECLEFVCHSPSEYFMSRNPINSILSQKPEFGFLMTRTGPQIVPLPEKEEKACDTVNSRPINCE